MKINATDLRSSFQNDGILKSFTIAFSPRCGSTLLSNILAVGGAGKPTEYFQYPYDANEYFKLGKEAPVLSSFQSIVREHCANKIFGSKMAHDHRARLDELLTQQIANYEGVDSILPDHKWIFVKRKDLIRQAISLCIAQATGVWHMKQDQPNTAEPGVEYDFFAILSGLTMLLANNFNWGLYFERRDLSPLTIFYEDFLADKTSALKSIATHLGLESNILTNVPPNSEGGLAKISDRQKDLYERMRQRFTDDFIKIGQTDDRDRLGPDVDRWNAFFMQRLWHV
jgi:trehalose 2-sulfotransferase